METSDTIEEAADLVLCGTYGERFEPAPCLPYDDGRIAYADNLNEERVRRIVTDLLGEPS